MIMSYLVKLKDELARLCIQERCQSTQHHETKFLQSFECSWLSIEETRQSDSSTVNMLESISFRLLMQDIQQPLVHDLVDMRLEVEEIIHIGRCQVRFHPGIVETEISEAAHFLVNGSQLLLHFKVVANGCSAPYGFQFRMCSSVSNGGPHQREVVRPEMCIQV